MEGYIHRQIHDQLLRSKRPVLICDERIDGDSLGSALAVADYLISRGVKPTVHVSGPVPDQYAFLPRVELAQYQDQLFDDTEIDLVIVFDCSDDRYIKRLVELIPQEVPVINIDHHTSNIRFGDINQVLTDAPATAEIIYRFFRENHILPSKDAATCLLTGICFDTNVFSNDATDRRALESASELILYGARVQDVIRTMYMSRSVGALRVWGMALERLYQHKELDVVCTFLTRSDIEEHQVSDDELAGLTNFLNLVTDVDTLMVLRETPEGGVNVSMRSQTKDVSKIAVAFGGGGHQKAAGFTIPKTRLHCTKDQTWCLVDAPAA